MFVTFILFLRLKNLTEIKQDVDVPSPTAVIDQDTDQGDATIVKVSFDGPLGHLVDTVIYNRLINV